MRAACLGVLATLCVAAASWRSLLMQYHLYRLRTDPGAFKSLIAGPRSREVERALESFARTEEGTVRIVTWLLALRAALAATPGELARADLLVIAPYRKTGPNDASSERWGMQVSSVRLITEDIVEAHPLLELEGSLGHPFVALRAIWGLLPHASREELSLPEQPWVRGCIVPREEAAALLGRDLEGDGAGDSNVRVSPLVVLVRRATPGRP